MCAQAFSILCFYSIEDNEIIIHSVFDNRQDPAALVRNGFE